MGADRKSCMISKCWVEYLGNAGRNMDFLVSDAVKIVSYFVLKKFLLSITYGVVPCELADIHLFLNYKNGSFIWFNLKLISDTFAFL